MLKNNLNKIIGAVSSVLIIISVFIPYIQTSEYSDSIWSEYVTSAIQIPILLIAFGAFSLVLFLINKKIELAYISTGGVLFFLVMRTVQFVQENAFINVSVGYYLLCIGALFTTIMAFMINRSSNKNTSEVEYYDEDEFKYSNDRKIPQYQTNESISELPKQDLNSLVSEIPEPTLNTPTIVEEQNIDNSMPTQNQEIIFEQEQPVQPIPVLEQTPVMEAPVQPISEQSQVENMMPVNNVEPLNQTYMNNVPFPEVATVNEQSMNTTSPNFPTENRSEDATTQTDIFNQPIDKF